MTREEVRAETDRIIDEAVRVGNENNMDAFEIGLVNGPFRSFAHMLDDAQAMGLDVKGVGQTLVSHMANLLKAYLDRCVPKDQYDEAVLVANSMFEQLADFTTTDIVAGWTQGKPN